MRFRRIPKSSTLDDLEHKRIEDRPALSTRELLRTESTFRIQRYIDYVDIARRS